jgi:hypothetical protein
VVNNDDDDNEEKRFDVSSRCIPLYKQAWDGASRRLSIYIGQN